MVETASSPASPARALLPILAAIATAGVGFGAGLPLLAFLLEREGTSSTLIGASTAMNALAAIAITPLVPRLLARFGPARVLIGCLLAGMLAIVIMRLWVNVWFWFPVRFVFGAALAVMFVATEFWINAVARDDNRGKLVGAYAAVFSAGWAIGPLMLGVFGPYDWHSVIAVCVVLALAILPLAGARASAPPVPARAPDNFRMIMSAAPIAILAAFVYGGVEIGIFALLPIYGLRAGLGTWESSALLTSLALGNVALQYPLGYLADRVSPKLLLLLCAFAGCAGAVTLPVLVGQPALLYVSVFFWGGVVVGLYTLGLIILGGRFSGGSLATANALYVMFYAVGGLLTPPLAGLAMDVWRPHGLAVVLGFICGAYALAVLFWRDRSRT